jgi:hypothetical protein
MDLALRRYAAMGYEAIPPSLGSRPQWLVWRFESKDGEKKPRKVPYYVAGRRRTGEQGTPEDRAELCLLERATSALVRLKMDGVGFAFLPGDGLIGIDIDGAIDLETGVISDRARSIIEACSSYTEYSPSRKGVHIIVAGESHTFKSNDIGLEVFCGRQFFTFTGERYSGTPEEVMAIDGAVLRRLQATVDQARGNRRIQAVNGAAVGPVDERAKLESALAFVSADCGYDDWIQVGMGLFRELGAGGLDVWDHWSSRSAKYPKRGELETHWRSFERDGVHTVTGAKIFRMATDAGWRSPQLRVLAGGKKETASAPPDRSAKKEKPKAQRSKEFWQQVSTLGERFTLIYGTDTAYDHTVRRIIKVANMRLAFGKDPVNFWLASPDRRMVLQDNVVFDPTNKAQLPEFVNLFFGMQLKPDSSKPCDCILELLFYLCDEEEAVFEWILKWMAYPLQHPGAKMESAIVMHGEEGLGKNLLWNFVSAIYGEYSTVITQNELESQFNTWASRKLFMVANEVVSRSELREHKGRLKNYITESELQINEKMLPLRTERNHMNFVFLSNETQPLVLDRTDRRYLVVWTPAEAKPMEFYQAVGAELRNGGAAGLYAHLLAMDLGDFSEHTKPIITQAKRDLIEISKTPPELFFDQWSEGLLPVPFISALAEDLYRAFIKWCAANGERHPWTMCKFGRALKRLGIKRSRPTVTMPSSAAKKTRTVYEVAIADGSEHEGIGLDKLIAEFSYDLDQWSRGGAT